MFTLSGGKIVLVLVIALLLFGPDKIPQMARLMGRFMREFSKYKDLMDSTVRAEIYKADWKVKAEEQAKARGEEIYGDDVKPSGSVETDADADENETVEAEAAGAAEAGTAPVSVKPAKRLADVIATDEDEEDEE